MKQIYCIYYTMYYCFFSSSCGLIFVGFHATKVHMQTIASANEEQQHK